MLYPEARGAATAIQATCADESVSFDDQLHPVAGDTPADLVVLL